MRREIIEQEIFEIEGELAKRKLSLEMHKEAIVNLTDILTNLGVVDD